MSTNPFQKTRLETAIWGGKLLLLLMGMVSTMTLLKAAVIPYALGLALSTIPQIWMSFRSWLSPFYIYLVVNFIIVAIAASSTFQPKNDNHSSPDDKTKTKDRLQFQSQQEKFQSTTNSNSSSLPEKDNPSHCLISWGERESFHISEEEKTVFADDDPLPEKNSGQNPTAEEDSTLEDTWKAIMEGQGKAMGRQLKKSETWDVAPDHQRLARADNDDKMRMDGQDDLAAWARRELKKSETFSDRVSLRRDKSMSPEELNRRAEAFIKKVNNDIRLQRLESDQRFLDMVNRGL